MVCDLVVYDPWAGCKWTENTSKHQQRGHGGRGTASLRQLLEVASLASLTGLGYCVSGEGGIIHTHHRTVGSDCDARDQVVYSLLLRYIFVIAS